MTSATRRTVHADLSGAIAGALPRAEALFEEARARTADTVGVSREPYGVGENAALDALTRSARELEFEIGVDPFGNAYFTLSGEDRTAPGWLVGSHVDSVPQGGNFDGYAGVVSGITALAAFRRAGLKPRCNVTVMGIRAEELSAST